MLSLSTPFRRYSLRTPATGRSAIPDVLRLAGRTLSATPLSYQARSGRVWNASLKVPSSEAHPGYLEDRLSERYPGLKTCAGLQSNEDRVRFGGRGSVLDWNESVVYALKVRNGWDKFSPPVDRHLDQLHIYMKGLGVDRRKLVYVSKNDLGDIREWPEAVPDELAITFDAGRYERVVESQARL